MESIPTLWGPEVPLKRCSKCSKSKPFSEFTLSWKKARQRKERYAVCRACHAIENRKNRDKFPEKHRIRQRRYKLNKYEQFNHAKYVTMLEDQQGLCGCCGRVLAERDARGMSRAVVDHNHSNGKVRAILCNGCNLIIGCAREDQGVLLSAIAYLERHKA